MSAENIRHDGEDIVISYGFGSTGLRRLPKLGDSIIIPPHWHYAPGVYDTEIYHWNITYIEPENIPSPATDNPPQ